MAYCTHLLKPLVTSWMPLSYTVPLFSKIVLKRAREEFPPFSKKILMLPQKSCVSPRLTMPVAPTFKSAFTQHVNVNFVSAAIEGVEGAVAYALSSGLEDPVNASPFNPVENVIP